jgi:hypothetical protein
MANKSLQHSSLTDNSFYRSMLAGNDAYLPEFESDDFLEEVVLTSSASSVTFSGLASYATAGYKHLQIRGVARTDRPTYDIDTILFQLNSDTGNNYAHHSLTADGSSVTSGGQGNESSMQQYWIPSNLTTDVFGAFQTDILDFSNTSKNTTLRSMSGFLTSTYTRLRFGSGVWLSTAAVTSIKIYSNDAANFLANSRFSLYGSKG